MKAPFLKDVGVISIAQALAGAAAFCYTILAARFLGVTQYGLFQAVLALYGSLSMMSLPLNLATVHCVGRSKGDQKKQAGGEFLRIALIGGGGTSLLVVVLSPWLSQVTHAPVVWPFVAMAALLVLRPLLTVFYGILQGENRHSVFSISKIFESFICLGVGTALILLGAQVTGAIGGYVVAMAMLILFFLTRKNLYVFRRGFERVQSEWFSIVRILIAFGMVLVIANLPVVVGRARLTPEASGWLGALYSLRNIVLPFAFAVSVPFYTRTLARSVESAMIWKALGLISVLGGSFMVLGMMGGSTLISALYGEPFVPAASYLFPYGFSVYLEMLAMVGVFYLSAKQEVRIWVSVLPGAALIGMAFNSQSINEVIAWQIGAWICYLSGIVIGAVMRRAPKS